MMMVIEDGDRALALKLSVALDGAVTSCPCTLGRILPMLFLFSQSETGQDLP